VWIPGEEVVVEHCQHCSPRFFWLVNRLGKAPQFAFREFPKGGQAILSSRRVIVVCSQCEASLQYELKDVTLGAQEN